MNASDLLRSLATSDYMAQIVPIERLADMEMVIGRLNILSRNLFALGVNPA